MRTPVVVVLYPEGEPGLSRFEAVELRTPKIFIPDSAPESFDLAQRHRVLRTRLDVADAFLLQLGFKA